MNIELADYSLVVPLIKHLAPFLLLSYHFTFTQNFH